jgi:hypothetical protein
VRCKFCGYDIKSGPTRFIRRTKIENNVYCNQGPTRIPQKEKSYTHPSRLGKSAIGSNDRTYGRRRAHLLSESHGAIVGSKRWVCTGDSMSMAAPIFRIGMQLRMKSHMSPLSYRFLGFRVHGGSCEATGSRHLDGYHCDSC